jgi:hypothetical protein
MAETKKTTITLDEVDYIFEDMTPQQQAMVKVTTLKNGLMKSTRNPHKRN